jgi:cellulose synthase/poly-beta-1,6-N-acetylglucosamine synthase-like glycosyltransferase
VTEDYALVHAIATQTHYRVRFPMDPWTLVLTEPCTTVRQLFHQKKRWFVGGRDMDAKSIAIFGLPYLFSLLLVASPFFVPVALWLPVLGVKALLDFGVLLPALIRFKGFRRLAAFPLYEAYYFLYVLLYPPFVLLDRRVVWKERSFASGK